MSLPFRVDRTALATPRGTRTVLVATPTSHLRVGRDRLHELRENVDASVADDSLAEGVLANRDNNASILIFRGESDNGTGSWHFAEDLRASERAELARLLVVSQRATYRRFARYGVSLCIHVELRAPEVHSFRDGVTMALDSMENSAIGSLDRWIFKHHVFFFGNTYAGFMGQTLPGLMPMLEQRRQRMEMLLAEAPA